MGGYANVDDDVFEVPGGLYRGVAPRSLDAKSQQWSIWWIDSRTPLARLDPPRERPVPKWSRNALRRRHREREGDSYTIHLVQDHTYIMSLGAAIFAGRWQDLGNELGAGSHASAADRIFQVGTRSLCESL